MNPATPRVPVLVRPARVETDLPAIAAVVGSFDNTPVLISVVRSWFEHNPPGRITQRRVAEDGHGAVIGYSVAVHENWWPEGEFYAWVGVLPEARRLGAGCALSADVAQFLTQHYAQVIKSEVRDDDPLSLGFAERRGFSVDRQRFRSTLDLAKFDESRFAGILPALESQGLRFFTYQAAGDDPDAPQRFYELNRDTTLDIPGEGGGYLSYEEFTHRVLAYELFRPEAQFIAAQGDNWAGFAAVTLHPETQSAYNWMTGVIRPYRGRKIAQALKLLAIRYAREQGAEKIETDNDSMNAPMLAINRKLGYQPQAGNYVLVKKHGNQA